MNPKISVKPDLTTYGNILLKQILATLNCHALGTVQVFDETTQSAQVSINYKRTINGALADYPVLVDCPVVVIGGGGGNLTFPIAQGDTCLVFFNDRDMDTWVTSGQIKEPNSDRLHAYADAVVLVGVRAFAQALANYDPANVVLHSPTKISIENDSTNLKTVINGLIDLIAAITVTPGSLAGPSSPPINAAAITAYKTTVGGLLK